MPDDTFAKPEVGRDAGHPITKSAAPNGVRWPTRISPAAPDEGLIVSAA